MRSKSKRPLVLAASYAFGMLGGLGAPGAFGALGAPLVCGAAGGLIVPSPAALGAIDERSDPHPEHVSGKGIPGITGMILPHCGHSLGPEISAGLKHMAIPFCADE